jgi:hypothetical protein
VAKRRKYGASVEIYNYFHNPPGKSNVDEKDKDTCALTVF